MKQFWSFLLILFTLQITAQDECAIENNAFKTGEELEYLVYYTWKGVWVKAASVDFKVNEATIDNESMYHFHCEGKTLRRYDWIFKVRDYFDSWTSKSTLQTMKFKRDVNEGGYWIKNYNEFDYEAGKIHTIHSDYKGNDNVKREFDLKACYNDILAALYRLRNTDITTFGKGDTIPIEMFIDDDFYALKIVNNGTEKVKTEFGTFDCIIVNPSIKNERIFGEDGGINIYVTNDENRVPIMIEANIRVGSVKAILKDFDNLKHKMTSKVS